MASSLAKHRYFAVVTTGGATSDAAGVARTLRKAALREVGEVGVGRLNLQVLFFDAASRVCVVRSSRAEAARVRGLLGGGARVAAVSGSLRTCRPRVEKLLRQRGSGAVAFEALGRLR